MTYPSIQTAMLAMLGGPDVVEKVLDFYEEHVRAHWTNHFASQVCQVVSIINYRGCVQCPFTGKLWYRRHVTEVSCREDVTRTIIENTINAYTLSDMEAFKEELVAGDPEQINLAWSEKEKKMIEEGMWLAARGKHHNVMNRVLMELLEKVEPHPAAVENFRYASHLMFHAPFNVEVQNMGRGLSHSRHVRRSRRHSKLCKAALYFDDNGNQDYGNINFFDIRSASDWSCTSTHFSIEDGLFIPRGHLLFFSSDGRCRWIGIKEYISGPNNGLGFDVDFDSIHYVMF